MSDTTLIDRALIRLSGEDVRDFLQGLVTNDVEGDLPVWAGLLTAQGKALFDFIVWADGDDLLIDCEASQAEALARRLTLYRLRKPIRIEREPQPRVAALCYMVDRGHVQYAGRLTLEQQLHHVRQGHGQSGANRDYVIATVGALEQLGYRETELHLLAARLAGTHEASATSRPSSS